MYFSSKKLFQKDIFQQDKLSILTVIILGSLSHFLYEFSGKRVIFALFCPVNESVWEHLKLLFFPFLLITILNWYQKRPPVLAFFYHRFLGIICAMFATLILFYTYTGIIGRHFLIADLTIFVFSVIFAFYINQYFQRKRLLPPTQEVVFSLWILLSICFFVFTCYPPDIALFFPPQ